MTFQTGRALIQNGTFNLIHIIDIETYERELRLINEHINYEIEKSNPLMPFLQHEILELGKLMDRIRPFGRTKRSINEIGTVWKWIAGSPDRTDLEILTDKINDNLRQTENQIVINRLFERKLNELTNLTNEITNYLQKDNRENTAALGFKFELQILKEEVSNIEQALLWSKAGIINSFLFSHKEMEMLDELILEQNFPFNNLEQCLKFANVKVASNNSILLYVINLPIVDKVDCETMIVKPIKINSEILKLDYETIMTCKNRIFGIRKQCENYDEINLCKENNIQDITNSSCIPNLLKSIPSTCRKSNNLDIPSLELIQDGLLLFNKYNGSILINGNHININGTFVVQYNNATITVGNLTFSHYGKQSSKPLPAILSSLQSNHYFEESLSLQLVKELHLNNSKTIQLIKKENNVNLWESTVAIIICVIIIIKIALKFATKMKYKINSKKNNTLPIYSEIKKPEIVEFNGTEDCQTSFTANGDVCI